MSEPEQWHVAGTVVRNQHDQDICYMAEKNQWEPGCGEIPIEVQIARARLIAAAPELLHRTERSAEEHDAMAALLDAWARESVEGGWSTHQVDAMRKRADVCRRFASDNRAAIRKATRGQP